MLSTLTAVEPVRPAAPYIGGKRYLARRLVTLIEETPHDGYAEAFVGMGGVFLRRRRRPKVEVINDWSRDVAGFYLVLREHYAFFRQMLRFQLTSRAEFDRLSAQDPETLTDLQRAARFLYLQATAFGGKVRGRNFAMTPDRPARFDVARLGEVLEDLHARMSGVVIERLPWAKFLERYDRPGMLFYLDPPYYGSEDDYGADLFSREEYAAMAQQLRGLRGRFILSINDTPEVRQIFAGFALEAVGTHYGIAGRGAEAARELIITGGG